MALSGLSSIFTWGSICACHLIFRRALYVQGRGTDELSFVSQCGIIGSSFGVLLNCLILIAQFWVALFPIGEKANATSFFKVFLCVPILLVCYFFWIFYKKDYKFLVDCKTIDIDTGRREIDIELLKQEIAEEKALIASNPLYYRIYRFWC